MLKGSVGNQPFSGVFRVETKKGGVLVAETLVVTGVSFRTLYAFVSPPKVSRLLPARPKRRFA